MSGILGDYHKTSAMETFVASSSERHPTDLAGLRGARLVTATETEEGRRWAEARIKQLTGADEISARYMRQDFFEFRPNFKLWFAGNYRPALRGVGEAMRRRLHLLPFSVTIPAEERDLDLSEKLREEWPEILQWMIEGALFWQEEGLRPPEVVTGATDAYLLQEDTIAAWIDAKCEQDAQAWSSLVDLFRSWATYAGTVGEPAGSSKRFGQALESRSFIRQKRNAGQGFYGLRVALEDAPPTAWEIVE